MTSCPGCDIRDMVILMQKLKIRHLKAEIKRLQQIIKDGQTEAAVIISQADDIKSEHQPRGKWSYATGARRAAKAILSKLK